MGTYVMLMRLTDKGIAEIKSAPKRIEEGIAAFEAMGGKILGFYTMLGEYDYLAIGDLPDDETALSFALALSSKGFVRTTTLKAISTDAFAGAVRRLP
ncbi:MAG: GYD domain-containing protein [Methanomicrobiales archaeon]|nr:GYD domain-containing protein [Methanomicrobiales archaeon]